MQQHSPLSPKPVASHLPPLITNHVTRHGQDASEKQANEMASSALRGENRSGLSLASLARHAPSSLPYFPASVSNVLSQSGSPLPEGEKAWMSRRLGHAFDSVRIHHDGDAARSATEIGARAYTVGERIAFAPGEYKPGSEAGRHLLAHELTHVMQQKSQGHRLQMQPAVATAPADQRSFVQDTITFLNTAADFYTHVTTVDATTFDRVINGWYASVVNQERIIDADLGGDATLKAELHAAYIAALRVFVALRSASGGGSEEDLYRINSGRIPLWAQPHPSHLEAGVTTPIPDDVAVTQNRGNFLFNLNGFDVTVQPDTRVRRQRSDGMTHENIAWGGIRTRIGGPRGRRTITSINGPPTPRLTLFTSYVRGFDTTATSGYGRGTTPEDQAGARVTTESDSVAFHESRHSQATLDFIRANSPPAFTGQVGDSTATVSAAISSWQAAARNYSVRMQAADTSQVHCVGFTIDQFQLANARPRQRIVRECP